MQEVAIPLLFDISKKIPVVFDDLGRDMVQKVLSSKSAPDSSEAKLFEQILKKAKLGHALSSFGDNSGTATNP